MAIFDIEKNDLLQLTDTQLEELIARLAEAEVAALGHSVACVRWSGSINATDSGIDVQVQIPVDTLVPGFLVRADTVFQAKIHSMPASSIRGEMCQGAVPLPTITELAAKSGSYIIVSLEDDCSPNMLKQRVGAMHDAVKNDLNAGVIHLDFYDRSRLAQWLRQHPAVMLWVKDSIGRGHSGWQPYGAWSNPPEGADDSLIMEEGVRITLPSGRGEKLKIEEALGPMRTLIKSTRKAVRITGLSGVGKTRIVQALFDELIGDEALDRTIAVYADTGDEPNPSATAILERLCAEGRRAILVLDNCPTELHSSLASKVAASNGDVTLITVEYDIRDDRPQTTEVLHIETVGIDVAKKLLIRRYPSISESSAGRIAEFGDGNARVSLAIAERVEEGESLAMLTDSQLFNRLFEQRKVADVNLREQAEILSLVYSFSIDNSESGLNELEVIGSIAGYSRIQLFNTLKKLAERHILQKRSHWRAILPQAIANKLACSALDRIPIEILRETFEKVGHERLLMSFAHRLGLLHDHAVAKEIVTVWLSPNGLLAPIQQMSESQTKILTFIGPVAPEALLDKIEIEVFSPNFGDIDVQYNPVRTKIVNLLQSLAFDPNLFERCIKILIRISDHEPKGGNNSSSDIIRRFFQAYLSGTHASLSQRKALLEECVYSDVDEHIKLGFQMLSAALSGPPWSGSGFREFGARARDYGFHPSNDELISWRKSFIELAVTLGVSGNPLVEDRARKTFADHFRGLWHHKGIREILYHSARCLHSNRPWNEGWLAIRATLYFDYSKNKSDGVVVPKPSELVKLESELKPQNLIEEVKTYVFNENSSHWSLDAEYDNSDPKKYEESNRRLNAKAQHLGEVFAAKRNSLLELGSNLFSSSYLPYVRSFGKGYAKGSLNLETGWNQLVEHLDRYQNDSRNFAIFAGYIGEVCNVDPLLGSKLLDQCSAHSELRKVLVGLHPVNHFTAKDLDRCMILLDDPGTNPRMFENILWSPEYAHIPKSRLLEVAHGLLRLDSGAESLLEALSMKLHDTDPSIDTLGSELRKLGLKAAVSVFQKEKHNYSGILDYQLENVLKAALKFDGNENNKREWLAQVIRSIDSNNGFIHDYETTIAITASLMPESFLELIFEGSEHQFSKRKDFLRFNVNDSSCLEHIDSDILVNWCVARSEESVFFSVASGLKLWMESDDPEHLSIAESAKRLLLASPNPRSILEVYIDRVTPSSWSGSRAEAMLPRVKAFGELAKLERADIAGVAESAYGELMIKLEEIRSRESLDDQMREQRFE